MLATFNSYKETQLILQLTILSIANGYIQQPQVIITDDTF